MASVGAFWKPGDVALRSLPGQPGSAHGKPVLVDRQNPVLATGPICRHGFRGVSSRLLAANPVPREETYILK
jgi:hypothetical protein